MSEFGFCSFSLTLVLSYAYNRLHVSEEKPYIRLAGVRKEEKK